MTIRWLARIGFVLLFLVVTYLTLTPNPEDTEGGLAFTRWIAQALFGDEAFGDKVAHFIAYAALGGAAVIAELRIFGRMTVTILALAAYGLLLEGAQGLMGVRTPDLSDALANAIGALSGFPIAAAFSIVVLRRNATATR